MQPYFVIKNNNNYKTWFPYGILNQQALNAFRTIYMYSILYW